MTLTRTYYTLLIELMGKISEVRHTDPIEFTNLKKELSNVLNRVNKFNLIPLTFTSDFWNVLHDKTPSNFLLQKLFVLNELHYELHECLYTDRLRYGGELMFYLFELKLAILKLPISELEQFEEIIKIPEHYYLRTSVKCSSLEEQNRIIKLYKKEQKNSMVKNEKVVIKESDYKIIERELKKEIARYNDQIVLNYPSIANSFSFYKKKIRAYLTQALSKDVFEFRIHAYESNSKNSSVTLVRQYYDFYPAYFYNLEEISEKQTGATVTTLYKNGLNFHNTFTDDFIFSELINIYTSNSTEQDINKFVVFLLKCHFHNILQDAEMEKLGFDIAAEKENKKFLYEIYHRKNRSLDKIIERIQQIKSISSEVEVSFIFTSYPGKTIVSLLKNSNVTPVFFLDMIERIKTVKNNQIIVWFIKENLLSLKSTKSSSKRFEGNNLIERLKKCPPGEKNWSEYEAIGIDIFRFLFEDTFQSYITEEQAETDLKNHRRDLIVSNYYKDSTSFWAEAKQLYQSKAIIVDFKNYSDKLTANNYFLVSKYSTKKIGNFAIIFSRVGLDKSAQLEQRNLFADGKLLIEFNDTELKEMIQEKIIGKNPLDRLKSKEFEIITS